MVAQAGLHSEQTSQRWQPGLSVKGGKGTRPQEPHGEGGGWEHRPCLKQPGLELQVWGFHHHQPEGMPGKVVKVPPFPSLLKGTGELSRKWPGNSRASRDAAYPPP